MCARDAVLPKEFHEKYVGGNRMAIFIAMMVWPATPRNYGSIVRCNMQLLRWYGPLHHAPTMAWPAATCNYDGIVRFDIPLHHTRHVGRRQCTYT